MAKKKTSAVMPIAKCDVTDCTEDAAYGFREMIDVSHSTSTVREFIMGACPNWCQVHDAEQRPVYASKNGKYVTLRPSQTSQE